jgi:hypothetical protein
MFLGSRGGLSSVFPCFLCLYLSFILIPSNKKYARKETRVPGGDKYMLLWTRDRRQGHT